MSSEPAHRTKGRFVDLTVPWGPEVQPLEGHPRIRFRPITTHAVEGRSNTEVLFSIHTGTHIDSPYHFLPEARTIDQVPLERLIGPAILIDLTAFGTPRHGISLEEITGTGIRSEELVGYRVLLRTDWATRHYDQPDLYTENPYLASDAAKWLAEAGIRALGLDFAVDTAFPYPNHYIFLGREIPLIENLIHLGEIPTRRFTLLAMPLRVVGGDGGPARVAAWVEEA